MTDLIKKLQNRINDTIERCDMVETGIELDEVELKRLMEDIQETLVLYNRGLEEYANTDHWANIDKSRWLMNYPGYSYAQETFKKIERIQKTFDIESS